MADRTIDLEALGLRSGQAARIDMEISTGAAGARRRAARARDGPDLAARRHLTDELRVRAAAARRGGRARHLRPLPRSRPARRRDRRPRGRAGRGRPRRRAAAAPTSTRPCSTPKPGSTTRSRSALPERLLCRPDCAGLCAICGISLNEVDHRHPRPRASSRSPLREAAGPPGLEPPGGGDARDGARPATIPAPWQSRRNVNRARAATSAAPTTRSRRPRLNECPHCHSPRLPHRVCPTCGTYAGREVISRDETPPELTGRPEGE